MRQADWLQSRDAVFGPSRKETHKTRKNPLESCRLILGTDLRIHVNELDGHLPKDMRLLILSYSIDLIASLELTNWIVNAFSYVSCQCGSLETAKYLFPGATIQIDVARTYTNHIGDGQKTPLQGRSWQVPQEKVGFFA